MDDKTEVEIEKKKKLEKFSQDFYTWLYLIAFFILCLSTFLGNYLETFVATFLGVMSLSFILMGIVMIIKPKTDVYVNIKTQNFTRKYFPWLPCRQISIEKYDTIFHKIISAITGIVFILVGSYLLNFTWSSIKIELMNVL